MIPRVRHLYVSATIILNTMVLCEESRLDPNSNIILSFHNTPIAQHGSIAVTLGSVTTCIISFEASV